MFKRTTAAALLLIGGLVAAPSLSQTNDQTPLFRITVVGRTTPAVNYRPRKGDTMIDFAGTPLLPQARGRAKIEGEKGYIEVDANFDRLEPATKFGSEYLTYVLWAITPEGRATNLGELQVNGDDGRLHVTTELQAFGLIVTAEPYFAVTQPSDVVVMENVIRGGVFGTEGRVEPVQAKYELLKRGSYLMNQDASKLQVRKLEPGAPLDLAQARNAVALARLAGADRYAGDTFAKATQLLNEAEQARERRKSGNEVQQPARQAAQTAEDARLIAVQKQEEMYQAQLRAAAALRESEAIARARDEAERRQQAEAAQLSADAARLAAERERLSADAAREAAERDRAAAERERLSAEQAKADADRARAQADAARLQAESQAQQARDAAARSEQEKAQLRADLLKQLNIILETRETARGLIVNLSDVLFDTGKATLRPGAREKLAKVAGILLAHPDLNIEVDGHTDSVGATDYNQRLSEQRAGSVRDYMVRQGIPPGTVATAGFGETQPAVSNATAAGRQQNRRVEIVVSGEAIGRGR
jgi:outer membrane protein OmpA-like peptidoglycan-associated protein